MSPFFRRIFVVAFFGITTSAIPLPAAAAQSEVQLHLTNKAMEEKREKARIAEQEKQKLEECSRKKGDSSQHEEKNEG